MQFEPPVPHDCSRDGHCWHVSLERRPTASPWHWQACCFCGEVANANTRHGERLRQLNGQSRAEITLRDNTTMLVLEGGIRTAPASPPPSSSA